MVSLFTLTVRTLGTVVKFRITLKFEHENDNRWKTHERNVFQCDGYFLTNLILKRTLKLWENSRQLILFVLWEITDVPFVFCRRERNNWSRPRRSKVKRHEHWLRWSTRLIVVMDRLQAIQTLDKCTAWTTNDRKYPKQCPSLLEDFTLFRYNDLTFSVFSLVFCTRLFI